MSTISTKIDLRKLKMVDVFELLKLKEEENKQQKKYYVYYAPSTGEVVHFRNYLEEDTFPYIEILESDLDVPILEFDSRNYFVSQKDNKPHLIRNNNNEQKYDVDNVIYQVPKIISSNRSDIKHDEYELLIEQNNKDRVFRLKLSPLVKEIFYDRRNTHQNKIYIYVTAEDDPNILYQTLEFTIYDLIVNQYYTISFDNFDGGKCNLFSQKYFHLYLHMDIQ